MTIITPDESDFQHLILHLDMDAFYASVEQGDRPDLQGHPVIIGQSARGVVSAASYEARAFGIHSAMPVAQARALCPHGVFLPGRMQRYREVSAQLMDIMEAVCPVVEQASVDEAYADISGMGHLWSSPECLAAELKTRIVRELGLTSSIGIAPCRFLAKIASDWNKPDGLKVISRSQVAPFLRALPVSAIPGVGRSMQGELARLGVQTVADLKHFSREFLINRFGQRGDILHDRAHGLDPTPVSPTSGAKSFSAENTFDADTQDRSVLEHWLLVQAERVGRSLRKNGKKGRCVTLKLKFSNFQAITRSMHLADPSDATQTLYHAGKKLLTAQPLPRPVRLIGLSVSQFGAAQHPLPLGHTSARKEGRQKQLDTTMDLIRDKFGNTSIMRADAVRHQTQPLDLLGQKNKQIASK